MNRPASRANRITFTAFICACGVIVIPCCAAGQDVEAPSAEPKPAVERSERGVNFFRRIEAERPETYYLTGHFEQVRHSSLFTTSVQSSGRFHFLREAPEPTGGYFRCDATIQTNPVVETVWLLHNGESALIVPGAEQASVHRWDPKDNPVKHVPHLLLGFVSRADDVFKFYDVEAHDDDDKSRTRLTLQPWYKQQLGGVELLEVDFDNKTGYPSRVFVEEENGDDTEILISDIRRTAMFDRGLKDMFRRRSSGLEILEGQ